MKLTRSWSENRRQMISGWVLFAVAVNAVVWWVSASATSTAVSASRAPTPTNQAASRAGWDQAVSHAFELKGIGDGYPFMAPSFCQHWDPLTGVAGRAYYDACVSAGAKIELGVVITRR